MTPCTKDVKAGDAIKFSVRRDRIIIGGKSKGQENTLAGKVTNLEYQGTFVKVSIETPSRDEFIVHLADNLYFDAPLENNQSVTAHWHSDQNFHLLGTNNSTGNPAGDE